MEDFLSNRRCQLSTYLIERCKELPVEIILRRRHDLLVVVWMLGVIQGSRTADLSLFKLIGKLISAGLAIVGGIHFYSNLIL